MGKYKGCFSERESNKQHGHIGAAKAYALSVLNQQKRKPQDEF